MATVSALNYVNGRITARVKLLKEPSALMSSQLVMRVFNSHPSHPSQGVCESLEVVLNLVFLSLIHEYPGRDELENPRKSNHAVDRRQIQLFSHKASHSVNSDQCVCTVPNLRVSPSAQRDISMENLSFCRSVAVPCKLPVFLDAREGGVNTTDVFRSV